ncbi:cytochrome c oxidase subunit IVB [Domibacillus indicus]|uniref:cytochrome c oxidase subunit IVB n=1 Tax=Domibacillus TaxID=1433999 RepID=UPI001F58AD4D|nr:MULTISPECIES: cytochrome c oxidase subunit IVB [Domibacillus]MCI2253225.1 cytochrome c oxidase subunit IVB [Domibacillus sp. PGB-M46]MCM3787682.1 cytochrome c oxidase subunit IVB [Domibacillus indicus]WNS79832.1 cytochrome c oxidase subunit IVB [Domibacillus sp. DTU_2020_1001157_1_SI_ALB_TIR_016]
MANLHPKSGDPKVTYEYRRKKNAEEMRMQVITFTMMIFFTVIAFAAVGAGFSKWFVVPFVLLLAVVQVIFQLYYFMHMSHKGHEAPQLFMYSGIVVAFVTILAFLTIIWL